MLYNLEELMNGSGFENCYDKAIAEGLSHVDAVVRASAIIEEMTPDKVLRYALVVKNFEAEIDALKMEASKMTTRAKVKENKIEALKQRLEMFLPTDYKLEHAKAVVKFKKNPPSCVVDDESIIPDTFKKTIPSTQQLVKALLLDALKAGEVVAGAHMIKDKFSIQIK